MADWNLNGVKSVVRVQPGDAVRLGNDVMARIVRTVVRMNNGLIALYFNGGGFEKFKPTQAVFVEGKEKPSGRNERFQRA